MVSHDVEFCARFADEAALFFDGGVSVSSPPGISRATSFYTTAADEPCRIPER